MNRKNEHIAAQSAENNRTTQRREFLTTSAKSAAFLAIASSCPESLALATSHSIAPQMASNRLAASNPPVTPPPSSFLFFETKNPRPNKPNEVDVTQWLFITGDFTWSSALQIPMSVAVTDYYGPGWLLAPMWKPSDFVDAARVTKLAMGDKRNKRGPHIGVFQNPGSAEPRDGFVNLDGSVPFITWGEGDPNNGVPRHSNSLLAKLLKEVGQAAVAYWWGVGTAKAVSPLIDGVVDYIVKPQTNQKAENVVALWHAKNGTITAMDDYFQNTSPALLSRRKVRVEPSCGTLPTWPKVVSNITGNSIDLVDYMKVPRRSTLSWGWTNGATLGQCEVINLQNGKTESKRTEAKTPSQDLSSLQPGAYLFRVRNITKCADQWLEINFSIV